jgi:hypothetical protein
MQFAQGFQKSQIMAIIRSKDSLSIINGGECVEQEFVELLKTMRWHGMNGEGI